MAWKRGLLLYKLYDYQHELYDIFATTNHLKTVVNASRRWGKTTVALLYAIVFAIQHPKSQIKIATKTMSSLKKMVKPIWNDLVEDCPSDLRPKWSSSEGCYIFSNGSQIHIHGTDNQRHDNLRGTACDLGIVDEAAFCSDLRYIVQSVLLPQTITRKGRIIILSMPDQKATPSAEDFKNFCIEAQSNGSYYCKDVYDNKSLTLDLIEKYKKESGGENSIEWRVEWLVKFEIDKEKAIVPEWDADKFVLSEDFNPDRNPFFKFYHKYMCLDLGVKRDFTVGLAAYFDFQEATLYVLNEFHVKNVTTPDIVNMMKICELEAFGSLPLYRRVCDSDNPQLVNDMVSMHKIGISAVEKTTLEAMINNMRIMVAAGQVKIHPRCKLLIRTLEFGVWSNNMAGKLKQEFGRTEELGHMDAIAALNYLIKSLNRSTNPVPPQFGLSSGNVLISNTNGNSHNINQVSKAFVTPAHRNKRK